MNNLWEKVAIGMLSLLIAYWQMENNSEKDRRIALEQRVLNLEDRKVDKAELREMLDRIQQAIERNSFNNEKSLDNVKKDILERFDLFRSSSKK